MDVSHSTAPASPEQPIIFPPPGLLPQRAATPTTWRAIVAIQPALGDIAAEASFIGRSRGRRRWSDWERLKRRFSLYVGWTARAPRLSSSAVYGTGYRTILRAFEGKGG